MEYSVYSTAKIIDGQLYGLGVAGELDRTFSELMKEKNVLGRRYFYPLISDFSTYRGLPSATRENLPEAYRIADSVICLPMHHALSENDIERVLQFFK